MSTWSWRTRGRQWRGCRRAEPHCSSSNIPTGKRTWNVVVCPEFSAGRSVFTSRLCVSATWSLSAAQTSLSASRLSSDSPPLVALLWRTGSASMRLREKLKNYKHG